MTYTDARVIKARVNLFNYSPWADLGEPYILKEALSRATKVGVIKVLDEIEREDIRLFHKEEGLCGNI